MLKRLSSRILDENRPRRLALAAACALATLAVAQFLAPAVTRSAVVATFTVVGRHVLERTQPRPGARHARLPEGRRRALGAHQLSAHRHPAARRSLKKATLRVFSTQANPWGVAVRFVADDTWRENELTFNNSPDHVGRVLGHSGPVGANQWVEIDVTSELLKNPAIANGGSLELSLATSLYAFVGVPDRAESREAAGQFASRETATPPALRIEADVSSTVPTTVVAPTTTGAPTTSAPTTTTPPPTTPPTTTPPVTGARYVDSATGNDSNPGSSPDAAWREPRPGERGRAEPRRPGALEAGRGVDGRDPRHHAERHRGQPHRDRGLRVGPAAADPAGELRGAARQRRGAARGARRQLRLGGREHLRNGRSRRSQHDHPQHHGRVRPTELGGRRDHRQRHPRQQPHVGVDRRRQR